MKSRKFILDEYNNQGDISKFDGFAIGGLVPIAGDLNLLTNILLTFVENMKKYNKPLHFFGLSGNNIIPVILYIRKKYNIPITFDSSSYGAGAIRKEYWIDNGAVDMSFGNGDTTTVKNLPCSCPICNKCNVDDFKASGSISGGLIALHNLFKTIEYVNELDCLLEDEKVYMKYIKRYCKEEVIGQIEKVDYVLKEGIFKAREKYNMIKKIEAVKNKNIFGFE